MNKIKKQLFSAFAILGFTMASFAQIPNYVPSNGLVGYWPFNGNANDESGNGNNGTVNGGVPVSLTLDRFNLPNSAYNCDVVNAINGYNLSISNPALVGNFGVNSFSISLWFKTIQIDGPILWFGAYATNNSVWYVRSYVNGYVLAGVSGGSNVISNNIFSDDEWHNAVYVRDVNSFKSEIYVDGQLESQNNFTYLDNIVGAGNVSLRVGSNPYGTFFYGSIDDIGIWNRALSQQEIQQLYSGTSCVPPTASITAGGPTSFCSGDNVLLSAPLDTSYTYQWQFNGSNINAATSATYTANASGNYSVIISNGASCSDTSAVTTVTVNPLPTATITVAGATTFCTGANVVLNANTGPGLTYQWKLNETNISGATSASYTATAVGSYSVVVTNAATCSATSSDTTVTVNPLPTATITAAGSTSFCAGGSVVLNPNTGTGLTYQWKLNGSNISGATAASYTATAAGSYTVVVTNASTCSATSSATTVIVNPLPTATITAAGSTTFCAGASVVLNANTGTGLTYQWKLNGNNISGSTAASYTATAAGSYTVVVTNASTCSTTSSATTVTVNPLPTATITAAGSTTFCAGASVVLNANTGTGLTYQWKLNGNNISGSTAASYTATTAGSYTVVVTNASTCSATSSATTVIVNPLPTATITAAGATTFCAGGNVVLNANTGTGLTYQWKLNGTNVSGATSASYTATESGSYTVVVTNAATCSATSSATTVTVNPLPTATITAASSTTFCAGASVVLNANTGTGLTYQWKLNGSNINGATAASYTATTAGSYSVVVTNASTCSATSSATTVIVNPLPTATITAAGATTFCAGANVVLNANSGSGLSYQWKLNGSNINGATSASYTASAAGSYTVVVSNASTCSATSSATTVTVNPLPNVTLTSLPAFINIQTPSVALNGSPTGGSYSGQGISGTNFIPSSAGLGQAVVSYSYTSSAGCSGNVLKNTIVYDTTGTVCTTYETVFDTSYTQINDTVLVSVQDTLIIETLILGSNPIQSNQIKVYPNPAHSYLEIDNGNFALMGGYTIRIENNLGQVVFNQAVNQQLFSINLSTWTGDGVYYLHIINSNGITQEIKKIVLQ